MENTGAWATDLAGLLKRDTGEPIGATIGSVISLKPLKVSIMDGLVVIQSDIHDIYVSKKLKSQKKNTEIKGSSIKFTDKDCGTVKVGDSTGNIETLNVDTSFSATIQEEYGLKKDDSVLVLPDVDEKTFFIIDVLEKI